MQTWKLKKKPQRAVRKPWAIRSAAIFFLVFTVFAAVFDFPVLWNKTASFIDAKIGWSPFVMNDDPFRLGLDLQGGTHLIYEADMKNIPDGDRGVALEGVRDVIERRVNAFGVSEPVVQTISTGDTYRIILELAGVMDVSEAIKLIGETPVLEFKEVGDELKREPTQEELDQLEVANKDERAQSNAVLLRALAGENFDSLVSEFSIETDTDTTKGIIKNVTEDSYYFDYAVKIKDSGLVPGRVNRNLLENDDGISVFKYVEKTQQEEMFLSHILICFEGKTGCQNSRSAIDASIQIEKIKGEATTENFSDLAKEYSDDPSVEQNDGSLGWAVADNYVPSFGLSATSLKVGDISDVVETEFGYHIIYKQDQRTVPSYTIQRVLMKLTNIYDIVPESSPWKNTELSGKHLQRAAVEFDPNSGVPYVSLTFNNEGGDLFGKLTESNVGKPIAIFLDGLPISTPVVQQAIFGGKAIITGDFTIDEAKLLSQRLNAGALPVPVQLLSQQTIGPILGAASLQKSINAALLGFALVALYMIVLYRLPGLIAVVALVLFAVLNLAAYRLFGVTVTLAGIAGFVLSIGMAVDANVLIIERLKEELTAGRDYASATDEAFRRAWSAIRDGNLTTLIAAAILYWFSSSFIRGFALTLSIGVILSMFTAITVSRVYLKTIIEWKPFRKAALFGVKNKSV